MDDKDTIITVGVTEKDEYGHLWVTPQGGGDKIKISSKRDRLHPLFEQGKAVMLHWEVYKNIPYVSDAKLVEGELPSAKEPIKPEEVNGEFKPPPEAKPVIPPQERGMCLKEVGECIRSGQLEKDFPKSYVRIKAEYYKKISRGSEISFWEGEG